MMPASNKGVGMSLGFPDVCLTPAAPSPIPVPYPNMAMNAMATPFAPNVMISMMPGLNMSSRIPMTNGDEGGVAHAMFKQSGAYTMGHPMIYINSLPAINLLLPTTGNNYNNPLGAVTVPSIVNVFFTSMQSGVQSENRVDRFTRPVDLKEIEQLEESLRAQSSDLGVTAVRRIAAADAEHDGLYITHLRRNSMATRMGFRQRDELLAVEGRPVAELDPTRLAAAMAPETGRIVEFTVRRESTGRIVTLDGMRDDSVCGAVQARMLVDGVGYIAIDIFAGQTPTDVANAIRGLEAKSMRSLVIDLRGNPGGDADAALRLADAFLEPGLLMAQIEDGDGDLTLERSRQPDPFRQPLVLLIDGSTASAAELFAGALSGHDRAMLVGQNSFGKGAVQQLLPEPTGEGVLLATIASFMLPEGTPIEGRGLTPDVEVKSDPMQLRAATELAAERVCQPI